MSNLLPQDAYLSWLEIDLAAIRQNLRAVRAILRPGTAVFNVIKADAYGHGACRVARVLQEERVDMLCVARAEEAFELREAGISAPLLIFGPPLNGQAEIAARLDSAIVVCDRGHIEAAASGANKAGRPLKVNLKIDTGMGRIGAAPSQATMLAEYARSFPQLHLEGVMSHFASADINPRQVTEEQVEKFQSVHDQLDGKFSIKHFHIANSAGVLRFPEAHFNAVRFGVLLYGQYPNAEMERPLRLKPAMTLKTRIIYLKEVPTGTGLSYGHTFVTRRSSIIATIPLGYADGYPRHASNRTAMQVRGRPAPVVGRVCMDQTLLDVTEIAGVQMGDEVIAFGQAEPSHLHVEDVTAQFDSIGYEMTSRIGKRLPLFYSEEV